MAAGGKGHKESPGPHHSAPTVGRGRGGGDKLGMWGSPVVGGERGARGYRGASFGREETRGAYGSDLFLHAGLPESR